MTPESRKAAFDEACVRNGCKGLRQQALCTMQPEEPDNRPDIVLINGGCLIHDRGKITIRLGMADDIDLVYGGNQRIRYK